MEDNRLELLKELLKIDSYDVIISILEVFDKNEDNIKEKIEKILESKISKELFNEIRIISETYKTTIRHVEIFDTYFNLKEKHQLFEILNGDTDFDNKLLNILKDKKIFFIRFLVENRELVKHFILYQISDKDRKKIKKALSECKNSEPFIMYIERNPMGFMENQSLLDFEQMSKFNIVETREFTEFPGATLELQDGNEVLKIPGNKKNVEFNNSTPSCIKEMMGENFKFNYVQSNVYKKALYTDDNLLLCSPTGSGKTTIAMISILREIQKKEKKKIVYIAPMKALVSELYTTISTIFEKYGLSVITQTSDVEFKYKEIKKADIIIATPEKFDILTRSGYFNYDLFIIDEIHLLGTERGPVLEALVARTLRNEKTRIVALSASLPNYVDIGNFIKCDDENIFYYGPEYREVPINYEIIKTKNEESISGAVVDKTIENLQNNSPIIIFVHSKNKTLLLAERIKRFLNRIELSDLAKKNFHKLDSPKLKELLRFGIGIHHAGLKKETREVMESLYRNEDIKILVSTSTLAWGVNLPAKTVIICGTEFFEGGIVKDVENMDILQMLGRAGRVRNQLSCNGIIVSHKKPTFFIENMIESRLLYKICDCINAEICSGLSTFNEILDWMKYTFYYVRLITVNKSPAELLNSIVYSALKYLEKAGMVVLYPKIRSTTLGKIAAKYYISYKNALYYSKFLSTRMLESSFFSILEKSEEFKNIKINKEEIKDLFDCVPIPVKTEFGIVSQLCLANRIVESDSLQSCIQLIRKNFPRLLKALFEIALSKNLAISKLILSYYKAFLHGFFPYQTPLRHFLKNEKVLRNLELKEIPFDMLKDFTSDDFSSIELPGDIILTALAHVAKFIIKATVKTIVDENIILNVDIEKQFKMDENTAFHLFITDHTDQKILLWDTIVFKMDQVYHNSYYALNCKNTPFLNICVDSDYYMSPTSAIILDLRFLYNQQDLYFEIPKNENFFDFKDFINEPISSRVTTECIVVESQNIKKRYASYGYKAFTYEEFMSKPPLIESVTLLDTHKIFSNYFVELCIKYCNSNNIKTYQVGYSDVIESKIKIYGSQSIFFIYFDFITELNLNLIVEGSVVIVCPIAKYVSYLSRVFQNAVIADKNTKITKGIYLFTKKNMDTTIENENIKKVDQIHIFGTSYYDYESKINVDYSIIDIKKYTYFAKEYYIYTRKSKSLLYLLNSKTSIYYRSSNRKELEIYQKNLNEYNAMFKHSISSNRKESEFYQKNLNEYNAMFKYSVSLNTINLFNNEIRKNLGIKNILKLVCASEELILEINSDGKKNFDKLGINISNGKAYGITEYYLNRVGMEVVDEELLIYYLDEIFPIIRKFFMCLLEISIARKYLKTSFNIIFGLQNISKNFVDYENKFYNISKEKENIIITVNNLPYFVYNPIIYFFIINENGRMESIEVLNAGKYVIIWDDTEFYCLCDCYPGFDRFV